MKGLRNKLKDQGGASILLALLFFLLCSMVGASVLMAAVSNAGKVRSNREEQQKYLLLSSALRLVCDELTEAKYYVKYTYEKEIKNISIKIYEDGEWIEKEETHTYHRYAQITGEFQCGLGDVLPLTDELDLFFASRFPSSRDEGTVHYIYTPMSGPFTPATRELTLSVDTSEVEGLDRPEDTVTVRVRLDQDLRIRLTATLGQEKDSYIYTMEAQLTGQGQGNLEFTGIENVNLAGPVTWTLEWIAKKEAGDVT